MVIINGPRESVEGNQARPGPYRNSREKSKSITALLYDKISRRSLDRSYRLVIRNDCTKALTR